MSIKSLFAWSAPVILTLAGTYFLLTSNDTGKAGGTVIYHQPMSEPIKDLTNERLRQMPIQMRIDDVAVSLNIKQGYFDRASSTWTLDNEHAFFAQHTTTPIIYSHNRHNLFYNLRYADDASHLTLSYADGSTITLKYLATRFIDPNDASILSENNNNTVILMTCSGASSELRRIVYFRV